MARWAQSAPRAAFTNNVGGVRNIGLDRSARSRLHRANDDRDCLKTHPPSAPSSAVAPQDRAWFQIELGRSSGRALPEKPKPAGEVGAPSVHCE